MTLRDSMDWCRRWSRSSTELMFPDCCVLCRRSPLDTACEADVGLCENCQQRLLNDDRAACRGCGSPIGPHLPVQFHCLNCQRAGYRFQEVIRLGLYEDDLRRAVISGKATEHRALCVAMARLLLQTQRERLRDVSADVIAPVPSHWLKRLVVWHHQADLLAETIAAELSLPLVRRLLQKLRMTPDQSDLPRAEREKNLHNAFGVSQPDLVENRVVMLIDDVLTTRTTVNECARALRKAGAKRVVVVAVAAVE